MTRPLFVDVQDARKYVARINDYSTPETAAQALALEFDRVRKQGEELASEALMDAYDRGRAASDLQYRRSLQRAFADLMGVTDQVHVAKMRILHALEPEKHGPVPDAPSESNGLGEETKR